LNDDEEDWDAETSSTAEHFVKWFSENRTVVTSLEHDETFVRQFLDADVTAPNFVLPIDMKKKTEVRKKVTSKKRPKKVSI